MKNELANLLNILEDSIDYLAKYDVDHDDYFNEEIHLLRATLALMRTKDEEAEWKGECLGELT